MDLLICVLHLVSQEVSITLTVYLVYVYRRHTQFSSKTYMEHYQDYLYILNNKLQYQICEPNLRLDLTNDIYSVFKQKVV